MNDEFYILCIGNEKYIAHKLPGELRIIAKIEPNLDKQQQDRYANTILLALNNQPK